LVDQMFAEVAAHVPGFDAPTHQAGILISSPDAQVYYHADLPGQGLIQISGRKRVYLYPNTPPFVRPEHLEDIALFDVEVDIPYEPWYDRHARVVDLEPGQMLNWPLNAPHRVENLGTVNISMTVSYVNQDIRRAQIVNLANGMLRHRFGYAPKSRSIRGPSYFGKAVMQKLLRSGKWLKRERSARRAIDFRLDADHPGEVVDLPKAA
jgi:Cupin-like domain